MLIHVDRIFTLERIEGELEAHGPAGAIYYGAKTCWWSHHRGHTYWLPADAVCMTSDWRGFIERARARPHFYGPHGLEAFIAAHHANCRNAETGGPVGSAKWADYNAALDALDREEEAIESKKKCRSFRS